MGSKGSSTPTKQEVVQTNLPEYVRPYFERLLNRTEAESQREYEPYGGQRIADVGQDIIDSEGKVRDIAGAGLPGLTDAMGRVKGSLNYTPYDYADARQFTGAEVDKYMSPYMDAVIDRQKQGATEDYLASMPGQASQAIGAGAFGGSREGVQKGLAQSKYLDRLSDIEGTGRQQAFDRASGLFQADRTAQMGIDQARAAERGAATQIGLGAAGQLANLSERARAGDIQAAKLLEQIGKSGMARDQASLDLGYQDFLRQQGYPTEKLGLYSQVLRGLPQPTDRMGTMYKQQNPLRDIFATGISALGAYKGMGY